MDDAQIDFALVLQMFFAESQEKLQLLEEAALELEDHPEDPELLATIFRVVHTVKGNASSLGFAELADRCHELEDGLDRLRQGEEAVTPDRIAQLLQAADDLRRGLAHAADPAAGPAAGAPSFDLERPALPARPAATPIRTLRVDLRKLDGLLHLTGEIAVAHGRLTALLATSERGGSLDRAGDRQELLEIHGILEPLFGQLQERVTALRMVPVESLFRQQIRTVHDLASSQGKLARLAIEGGDVEVDAAVIEQLRDPLTHLIRNAVDHGIEAPEERRAAGKEAGGRIALRAAHAAGQLVVEVADDGAGLDRRRIAERARELGLLGPEGGEALEADLFQLLFEPGFSTAGEVTGLSGRGVGLDVVRRQAEALRGTVGAAGEPGRGSTFTLRLPLTLAILEGLTVEAAGETFVLPMDRVVECVELPPATGSAERAGSEGLFQLRGTPLPYLRLRELFALGGPPPRRENLVVVEGEAGLAGLAVDALRGKSQTVVQPLGRLFRGVQGISGSAVLGNGRVALILDVPALLRGAARRPVPLGDPPCSRSTT